MARDDNRRDIDIMIEIDPEADITVLDYIDLQEYIAVLFDEPADVMSRERPKPYARPAAMTDAIYAF